jgi:ABC-type multidrug transport system fused ATPase/permease subunit
VPESARCVSPLRTEASDMADTSVALTRALVQRPKILVLDEATSSVDSATDTLVQQIIQREFRGTTILSIAHRLETVADFDRIMVMEAGRIIRVSSIFKV